MDAVTADTKISTGILTPLELVKYWAKTILSDTELLKTAWKKAGLISCQYWPTLHRRFYITVYRIKDNSYFIFLPIQHLNQRGNFNKLSAFVVTFILSTIWFIIMCGFTYCITKSCRNADMLLGVCLFAHNIWTNCVENPDEGVIWTLDSSFHSRTVRTKTGWLATLEFSFVELVNGRG